MNAKFKSMKVFSKINVKKQKGCKKSIAKQRNLRYTENNRM